MSLQSVDVDGFSLMGPSMGGTWTVTGMAGWPDSVPMRRDRMNRAQQDGAWESTGHKAGRAITVSGMARFADPGTAKLAARYLCSVIGPGSADMTVIDSGGELHATVESDGDTKVAWLNHVLFDWTVLLFAPDPLKYGRELYASTTLSTATPGAGLVYPLAYPLDYGIAPGVTPGAVALANDGTAAYWPRLRIDGPVPNPVVTLVETGDWVRFNGTVLAGQWLDILTDNRRVLLNGQVSLRHQVSSSGGWLATPPGGGSLTWSADGADPAAKLSVWYYEGAWS